LPTLQRSTTHKLNLPVRHRPYAEALLTTEPQTLLRLLGVAEKALFERILELGGENASDERDDISRAIDVVLDKKTKVQTNSNISTGLSGAADAIQQNRG